ncbi:hypothetical protein [Treponema sp.]|uniref:hypothetical protein n=1 Tax=Treponema sp. TaxID=166 RepID=UPI00388DFF2D
MNYEPIFNKMTKEAFDKFIELNDIKIPGVSTKDEYKEKMKNLFVEDSDIEKKIPGFL